ncbi:MAG: NAD(P)H-quinone oxidoreductase subunit L [Cyanobium sp.]
MPAPIASFAARLPLALDPAALLQSIPADTLLVFGLYAVLAGAYLVAVPLLLYAWMHRRWTVMGKIERTAVYGLVFLFFPGLLLFAPFLNLRMAGQGAARP